MVTPFSMRRFISALLLAVLTASLAPAPRLAADLVWHPGTGWRVDGGVLSLLSTEDGRNALETMNKARDAEEAGNLSSALKGYARVAKRYGSSVYASEALYRTGLILQKRHQYYKAFASYQSLLTLYPNSDKFNQVVAEQYRIASDLLAGKRSYFWGGMIPGFKNKEKAIQYMEQIVANAPYSDYAPLSLMNAATGYRQIREKEEAIDALDRMINNYPKSVLTPDAYLKIAETHASLVDGPYYDQAATKEAITYFEDYLILFPGDSGAATAEKGLAKMKTVLAQSKMILADYNFKYRKNYQAAKIFYNEAITTYPDSAVATAARAKLTKVEALLAAQPTPGTATPAATPAAPAPEPKKKRFWLF